MKVFGYYDLSNANDLQDVFCELDDLKVHYKYDGLYNFLELYAKTPNQVQLLDNLLESELVCADKLEEEEVIQIQRLSSPISLSNDMAVIYLSI
jgi:hypothetical protein